MMTKTFAADLKAIREEKNISLRDISYHSRINVTILENLENGDYSFQPQTYIRAFLKQYINYLGLDVEEVLFDYDLARSGKYKSKRSNMIGVEEESKKDEPVESKEVKSRISEKLKELAETPKKIIEEKKTGKSLKGSKADGELLNKTSKIVYSKKKGNVVAAKENENQVSNNAQGKKTFPYTIFNSALARNITLIVFLALVLLGLYSLINILFLEGSNDKPEIIRQNFDDVVLEQERKILGKRTPEEIQDSIRRAAEESAALKDSVVLRISATGPGVFFLVTDSLNFGNPLKVTFEKNQASIFKAKRSFYISSANADVIKVTINNRPVEFGNKSISNIKLTKEGIVK